MSSQSASLSLLASSSHTVQLLILSHLHSAGLKSFFKRGQGPPTSHRNPKGKRSWRDRNLGKFRKPLPDKTTAPQPTPTRARRLPPLHEERQLLLKHLVGGLDITGAVRHQVLGTRTGERRQSSNPSAGTGLWEDVTAPRTPKALARKGRKMETTPAAAAAPFQSPAPAARQDAGMATRTWK